MSDTANIMTAPSVPSKLLGLELIRFACAMAVLVFHYHHFAMIGDGAAMTAPHLPLERLLYPFYRFGLFGVQIFWCISGFIFYWKYGEALAARRIDAKPFFWLRFSRLYPLHFVTLLMVAALQPLYSGLAGQPFVFVDDASSFVLQLLLGDQWLGPRALSFNGPIWSVSSEVFVYAAFFLMLRIFGRSWWIICAAIVAGVASFWSDANSPAMVCGAFFFAGGAAAELLRSDWYRRHPARARYAAGLTIIFCLILMMAIDLTQSEDLLWTWILIVTPPCLLLCAQEWRWLERFPGPIQAAGNLTYSVYLIHFPIQLIVAILVLGGGFALPLEQAWFLFAYLTTVILLGRIVFTRFELPVQEWIRAATSSRAREPLSA